MLLSLALVCAPLQSTPIPSPLVVGDDGRLRPDAARLAALESAPQVALTGLAIPGFEGRVASLERLPSTTADAELWLDGEPVGPLSASIDTDFSLWRGSLDGSAQSDVLLSFSDRGCRGWLRADGELWHLLAKPDDDLGWRAASSVWVPDRDLRGLVTERPLCETLEVPGQPVQRAHPAPTSFAGSPPSQTLFQARVAVETDYQYFELFNDVEAAGVYALALFGAMSDTYREQLGTRVDVAYLGLYSQPDDPWTTPDNFGGSIDALYEFQGSWSNGWPVEADLAHYVSGAGLGGGVAWVGVLGVADYAYSVSGNLAGMTPFPVSQGPLNWDYIVTSHETGHNFGTLHTHDYCPPIDECAPEGYWGECQTQAACVEGTIMSYCHLCDDGIANVRPEFHPTVIALVRGAIEQSALRPFEGIETTDLGAQLASASFSPTLGLSYEPDTNVLASNGVDLPVGNGALTVVGVSESPLPLLGGTLVPSLDLLLPYTTSSSTDAGPPATVGGSFPDGVDLVYQTWIVEPSGPEGAIATNAVRATLFRPTPPAGLTWVAHPTNGLEYAVGEPATWFHSKSLAEQSGGTLAAIPEAALQSWLEQNLFGGALSEDYWIGLTDAFSEGSFYWTSGASGPHTAWDTNEPNDFNGFEDYAEWWNAGASWNDADGFQVQRAIYQRAIGTQP